MGTTEARFCRNWKGEDTMNEGEPLHDTPPRTPDGQDAAAQVSRGQTNNTSATNPDGPQDPDVAARMGEAYRRAAQQAREAERDEKDEIRPRT